MNRSEAAGLAFLLETVFCFGQPAPVAPLPPGVEIKVQAQPQKATVGDPIQIDFDITLPKGYQASLPKLVGQLGDFTLLQVYPGPSLPSAAVPASTSKSKPEGTSLHHRARVLAAVYGTGEFEFPALQITIRAPDGREFQALSQPVKIQIQSILAGQDARLKPLKKQAEIQEPARWLLWFAIALLLLAIAGLAWWFTRRSRLQVPARPDQPRIDPLALAEADLNDLIGRRLLENGHVKQYYVVLSDIIKRIVEAGYDIQTIEKTTSEITEELRRAPTPPEAEEVHRIESVLLACDMVKFAKYVPTRTENEAATGGTFEILSSVKRRRYNPPVEGTLPVAEVP